MRTRCIFSTTLIAFLLSCAVAVLIGAPRDPATVSAPARGTDALRAARPAVAAVESVGLTVSDMERSIDFYSTVLAFEKVSDREVAGGDHERLQGVFAARMRVVRMRLGGEILELTEFIAPRGRAIPEDSRGNDLWFQHVAIIVSDMDRAYDQLRRHRVEQISPEPQTLPEWNLQAGGIRAIYFKDPDRHPLELLQFPRGKGDPRWHRPTDRLFLGIDHTAIAVDDTERSLRFYRDTLGLRIAGESENYGIEQERLNGVFGARVRITALRAGAGPGIELLEYLAPTGGRPRPAGTRANDLVHWQTRLVCADVESVSGPLRAGKHPLVSPGVVELRDAALGFRKGLHVSDPDGHSVQLVSGGIE